MKYYRLVLVGRLVPLEQFELAQLTDSLQRNAASVQSAYKAADDADAMAEAVKRQSVISQHKAAIERQLAHTESQLAHTESQLAKRKLEDELEVVHAAKILRSFR
jgi:hypothetical protein